MNSAKFREWLPVAVMLGFVPVGAVFAGAAASWFPQHALWVLLSVVFLGGMAVYFGDWPPIEYALFLGVWVVVAGLLLPLSRHVPLVLIGIGVPGAIVGYLWGGNLASFLDKPNVERLTQAVRDESADG